MMEAALNETSLVMVFAVLLFMAYRYPAMPPNVRIPMIANTASISIMLRPDWLKVNAMICFSRLY